MKLYSSVLLMAITFNCMLPGCAASVGDETPAIAHSVNTAPCMGRTDGDVCAVGGDPGLVARCMAGECVPYDCHICPRLPCQTVACVEGQCRQTAMLDGASCVAFEEPLSESGLVGHCESGQCTGTVECASNHDCPSVECTRSSCDSSGQCIGYTTLPGTACEYAPNEWSWCFNYTCQTPINAISPRQALPE